MKARRCRSRRPSLHKTATRTSNSVERHPGSTSERLPGLCLPPVVDTSVLGGERLESAPRLLHDRRRERAGPCREDDECRVFARLDCGAPAVALEDAGDDARVVLLAEIDVVRHLAGSVGITTELREVVEDP